MSKLHNRSAANPEFLFTRRLHDIFPVLDAIKSAAVFAIVADSSCTIRQLCRNNDALDHYRESYKKLAQVTLFLVNGVLLFPNFPSRQQYLHAYQLA
jgi:hypothetical protein